MAIASKKTYTLKSSQLNQIHSKEKMFSIPVERIVLLLRKSSNKVDYIPECYCCQQQQVLGRVLHQVSKLLSWTLYYCEKCKITCKFEKRKCSRTRNMKKLHLIHTVVALTLRLPTNIQVKLRNNTG